MPTAHSPDYWLVTVRVVNLHCESMLSGDVHSNRCESGVYSSSHGTSCASASSESVGG